MDNDKINKSLKAIDTKTDFLLYTTPNGDVRVEILLQDENLWLTQAKIADLFGVERSVVTKHLANIYKEGELVKEATCAKIAQVQATLFRIWATERLKEYIIKGFTMDDERLKNPYNIFGHDYFEEQLARIRDIRSSERRLYQKITDIYCQCSADYRVDSEITKQFFAQ